MTTGLLTYTGGLGVTQAVSLITVAGVTLSCVVTNPLATNIRVDLALVHLWARRERGREESINTAAVLELIMSPTKYYKEPRGSTIYH